MPVYCIYIKKERACKRQTDREREREGEREREKSWAWEDAHSEKTRILKNPAL